MAETNLLPLVTPQQLAAMMGVSLEAVKKWRQRGKISYIKVGQTVRFEQSEVESFIERHRKSVTAPVTDNS